MKKSELRHIIRQIIQEQKSKGTEVYSPEGCEKFDLYGYIMNSGNYPTYGDSVTYQNMSNDQVVSTWCMRCSDALNANGSFSFVSQVYQPPRDEPNCKCCPQYQNIDWPGEPEEPDTDIPFRDPNRDVGPPKPPRPPLTDKPFRDKDIVRPSDPPELDISMDTIGRWYCTGDIGDYLLEIDPNVGSTDCVYIADYDNPNNIIGYSTLDSCIASSACTGPTPGEDTDIDDFEWFGPDGEDIDCADQGSSYSFCQNCVTQVYAFQAWIKQQPDWQQSGLIQYHQVHAFFNESELTYCLCCANWQELVELLTNQDPSTVLEESIKTRLQKLANIQKKK